MLSVFFSRIVPYTFPALVRAIALSELDHFDAPLIKRHSIIERWQLAAAEARSHRSETTWMA